MKITHKFVALLSVLSAFTGIASGVAQEPTVLRDPRLRDEDISGTTINSTVRRLPSGLYEYRYDLALPASSPGEILSFNVDITCDLDFGNVLYPEPPYPHENPDASSVRHVPIRAYASLGPAGQILSGGPGVSFKGQLYWPLGLDPGNSIIGLRALSPAPPGQRAYELTPSMDGADIEADGSGWDYRNTENDPTVPWIDDFTVRGMLTAPACALPPPPDDPPPPPPPTRFAGTALNESAAVNGLLTYSAPLRDRFHVALGVSTVEVKIHYAAEIDPKTFKVEPAWARNLFNPAAGTSQTVLLPLKDQRNKFQLEVRSTKGKEPRKEDALDQSYKDRDVFEIRRDAEPPKAPGKLK